MSSNSSFPGYVIKSTTIAVDHWPKTNRSHLTHYFLTHAHTDHTKNLDSKWDGPAFYCSKVTKKLIVELNKVPEMYVKELELNKTYIMRLDVEESFNVTLIDANHCPGAVMYLFEGYFGCVLATGDFRYSPSMFTDTPLSNKEIEVCYLDNTYFHQYYSSLPTRDQAFQQIIQHVDSLRLKHKESLLIRLVLKKLGKEELLVRLSKHYDTAIVVSPLRYKRYTSVLNLDKKNFQTSLEARSLFFVHDSEVQFDEQSRNRTVFSIEPTAQHFSTQLGKLRRQSDNYSFQVAYTDHSSFQEIVEFIYLLKPKSVVPIVRKPTAKNIDVTNMKELEKYLSKAPMLDCSDKFKALLVSATSVRQGSILNMFNLTETKQVLTGSAPTPGRKLKKAVRTLTPIISRTKHITLRKRKIEIEYDSTPEKQMPKKRGIVNITNRMVSSYRISRADTNLDTVLEESNNDEVSVIEEQQTPLGKKQAQLEQHENLYKECVNLKVDNVNQEKSMKKMELDEEEEPRRKIARTPTSRKSRAPKTPCFQWAKLNDGLELLISPAQSTSTDEDELDETDPASATAQTQSADQIQAAQFSVVKTEQPEAHSNVSLNEASLYEEKRDSPHRGSITLDSFLVTNDYKNLTYFEFDDDNESLADLVKSYKNCDLSSNDENCQKVDVQTESNVEVLIEVEQQAMNQEELQVETVKQSPQPNYQLNEQEKSKEENAPGSFCKFMSEYLELQGFDMNDVSHEFIQNKLLNSFYF